MKYLCLVYCDEAVLGALSPPARARLEADSLACEEELASRGQLVVAHALQPATTASVVQRRGGRISQTDGPFVETREQLAGFLLVDVPDLNAAIQLAARVPMAQHGSIEVRLVAKVERSTP